MDLTCNAAIHQDSKSNRKWETIRVDRLSNPFAMHHATNSIIQKVMKMQLSNQTKTKLSVL